MACIIGLVRPGWEWKARGRTKDIALYKSPGPGCSTLLDMAIRTACLNINDMTAETLRGVEWQIGKQLWKKLVANELDSLHAWKVFAAAYPHGDDTKLRCRYQVIGQPRMELHGYIKPLVSISFQWITFLILSDISCSRLELINISKLSNIGVLSVSERCGDEEIGLDDSIVRAWARAATETGAFRKLRVFTCRAQRTITRQVFGFLSQFPLLAIFAAENCSIGPSDAPYGRPQGWRFKTGKGLSEFLISGGATDSSWHSILRAYFQQSKALVTTASEADSSEVKDDPIVLHISLGRFLEAGVAAWDGSPIMRCFYRNISHHGDRQQAPTTGKRALTDSYPSQPPLKKRVLRSSNQRDPVDLMKEFEL